MARISHSSNPRPTVVGTPGPGSGTRLAAQQRSSGAEFPVPRRQPAKLRALRDTLRLIRKELAKLRERYAARNTPAAAAARKAKKQAKATQQKKKQKPKAKAQPPLTSKVHEPLPRNLDTRYLNRTALGYSPTERT